MVYFYFGSDRQAIQKKAGATFQALQKKKPDASFVSFDCDSLTLSDLDALVGSQGLFEHKIVARLADVLTNKDISDNILKMLPAMKASENIIVWSEGELNKAPLEKIKKNAEKVDEINTKVKVAKKEFNVFALSDSLATRDRKKFWALLVEAFCKGNAPEAIHGTLWWKLKTLAMSSVRNKWSDSELQDAMSLFVDMYHKAHRGESDFEISLEKFALSL